MLTAHTLALSGATDWCLRWKKNGWKTVNGTEVQNKDEFQKLSKLCDEVDVKWVSCFVVQYIVFLSAQQNNEYEPVTARGCHVCYHKRTLEASLD